MENSRESATPEFLDPDYRYTYAESFLNARIATQIKILREQRGETQESLAARCGTRQGGLSRFEDVGHSGWKTDTLWKIARALGVRLHVSFETFGSLLEEPDFTRESLERESFEDDPAFFGGAVSSEGEFGLTTPAEMEKILDIAPGSLPFSGPFASVASQEVFGWLQPIRKTPVAPVTYADSGTTRVDRIRAANSATRDGVVLRHSTGVPRYTERSIGR